MIRKNWYSKSYIKDNEYVIEEIVSYTHEITKLTGDGIVTHVGGNGRFIFTINNISYTTEYEENICKSNNKYYDYSNINFNINIHKEWLHLYICHTDKESYWKEIHTITITKN